MFTTAISRIWLVGLVLFALTPILIAARPMPTDTQAVELQGSESTAPKADASGKITDEKRDPASNESPLATGN